VGAGGSRENSSSCRSTPAPGRSLRARGRQPLGEGLDQLPAERRAPRSGWHPAPRAGQPTELIPTKARKKHLRAHGAANLRLRIIETMGVVKCGPKPGVSAGQAEPSVGPSRALMRPDQMGQRLSPALIRFPLDTPSIWIRSGATILLRIDRRCPIPWPPAFDRPQGPDHPSWFQARFPSRWAWPGPLLAFAVCAASRALHRLAPRCQVRVLRCAGTSWVRSASIGRDPRAGPGGAAAPGSGAVRRRFQPAGALIGYGLPGGPWATRPAAQPTAPSGCPTGWSALLRHVEFCMACGAMSWRQVDRLERPAPPSPPVLLIRENVDPPQTAIAASSGGATWAGMFQSIPRHRPPCPGYAAICSATPYYRWAETNLLSCCCRIPRPGPAGCSAGKYGTVSVRRRLALGASGAIPCPW